MISPEEIKEGYGFFYCGCQGLTIFTKFGVADTKRKPVFFHPKFFQAFMGFLAEELNMEVALVVPRRGRPGDVLAVFFKDTPPEFLVPEFFGLELPTV